MKSEKGTVMLERRLKKAAKRISRDPLNARLSEFVSSIPEGSRVLNVGSGGEIMKTILRSAQPKVEILSSDIDPNRSPDVVDDITDTLFDDSSFDYVICSEVLEHVRDPFRASENILRILKPGGQAFISTPFQFPTHDAPHDYFRYTEYGLRHLLRNFSEATVSPKGTWLSSILLVILRGLWYGNKRQKMAVYVLSLWLLPAIFATNFSQEV